jgi:regulator of sigma E protease
MRVDEFGIGFPPRLFRWKKGETVYCINLLPLGGYVKIHGENPEKLDELIEETEGELKPDQKAILELQESRNAKDEKRVEITAPHDLKTRKFKVVKTNIAANERISIVDSDPRAFNNRPVLSRMAVLLAGVTMNFLFALIVLTIGYSVGFVSLTQPLEDVPGAVVTNARVLISGLTDVSAAQRAGLEPGDYITKLSNPVTSASTEATSVQQVRNWTKEQKDAGATDLLVTVDRDGTIKDYTLRMQGSDPSPLGVQISAVNRVRVPVWRAPGVALRETYGILGITWDALKGFGRTLVVKHQLDQSVSGPVGVYEASAAAAHQGMTSVILLAVVLSINLGLLNILPIPALDGGKLVFLFTELIFRRRVIAEKVENALTSLGFLVLIGLILVITVRDISKFI